MLPHRTYHLRANSKAERDQWVDMLTGISKVPISLPHYESEKLVFSARDQLTGSSSQAAKQQQQSHPAFVSLTNIQHSGMLYKTGRINTAAKLRWCVVKDHTLYYFQKKEATRDAPYYGSIPLQGGTQLRTSEDSSTSFSLIAPDRVFYLRAPSVDEYRAWITVLRAETLGTINRLDEEEAPEKLRAKREFSRHTVNLSNQIEKHSTQSGSVPSSNENLSSAARRMTMSGSAPTGFGDMLGSSPSSVVIPVPSLTPPQQHRPTIGSSSPGSMSERRFFEKVFFF